MKIGKKAYTGFAGVYDCFMRNIPYDDWARRIDAYLKKQNLGGCAILELGCGTGAFTIRMAKRGYRMTGIDRSAAMLKQAVKKTKRARMPVSVSYRRQDMRFLHTDRRYPVVLSVCDSMNYLENSRQLFTVFEKVARTLTNNGLFLFDLKTDRFYRRLGNRTYTEKQSKGSYVWKNRYDPKTRNNYYDLTFFVKNGFGVYRKFWEFHVQHVFFAAEVEAAARRAGLCVKASFGADFSEPALPEANRIYFVLGKETDNA